MLRSFLLIILLNSISLSSIQSVASDTSLPLQLTKQTFVLEGKFTIEIPLEAENPSTLHVINDKNIDLNTINMTLPDGTLITNKNQVTYGVSFTSVEPSQPGSFGGLSIQVNPPVTGLYKLTGVASDLSPVMIIIFEEKPSFHYQLTVGNNKQHFKAHKEIPLTLQLLTDNKPVSDASVQVVIVNKGTLFNKYSFKKDSKSALYRSTFYPESTGDYELLIEVNLPKGSGEVTGQIMKELSITDEEFGILGQPKTQLIDTNMDGYADDLVIEFDTFGNLPQQGKFNIYSKIEVGNETFEDFRAIETIERRAYARFSGKKLREAAHSGPITIKRFQVIYNHRLVKVLENLVTQESFSSDTWARDNLLMKGDFSDRPIDLDGDGLFDAINISFEVDCLTPGDYALNLGLSSDKNQATQSFGNTKYRLHKGLNTVDLVIHPGRLLVEGEVNHISVESIFMYPHFKIDMGRNSATLMKKFSQPLGSYHCKNFKSCEPPVMRGELDKRTL